MAEAVAALSIVASITQLVDFGSKILHRFNEFQTSIDEVPKSFRHIKAELPLLLDTLKQTKEAIDAGSLKAKTKTALLPIIQGCGEQVELLDAVLVKLLPEKGSSWTTRSRKAFLSVYKEDKVEKIRSALREYIQILTYYHAAAASTLQPSTGTVSRFVR